MSEDAKFKRTLPKSISECAARFCRKYEIHKRIAKKISEKIDVYTHNLDMAEYFEFYDFLPLHEKISDFEEYEFADRSQY